MKRNGLEGNEMAYSGASENEKEWCCGKCRGVEGREREIETWREKNLCIASRECICRSKERV